MITQKPISFCIMKPKFNPYLIETLEFRKGDLRAYVLTNGQRHRTHEGSVKKEHATFTRAIAYLEAKGYTIDASSSKSYQF